MSFVLMSVVFWPADGIACAVYARVGDVGSCIAV